MVAMKIDSNVTINGDFLLFLKSVLLINSTYFSINSLFLRKQLAEIGCIFYFIVKTTRKSEMIDEYKQSILKAKKKSEKRNCAYLLEAIKTSYNPQHTIPIVSRKYRSKLSQHLRNDLFLLQIAYLPD